MKCRLVKEKKEKKDLNKGGNQKANKINMKNGKFNPCGLSLNGASSTGQKG